MRSRVVRARRTAFLTSRLLGDVRAMQTGRVFPRLINRVIGRTLSKAMRGVWR